MTGMPESFRTAAGFLGIALVVAALMLGRPRTQVAHEEETADDLELAA
jgi:hypothetical protein